MEKSIIIIGGGLTGGWRPELRRMNGYKRPSLKCTIKPAASAPDGSVKAILSTAP